MEKYVQLGTGEWISEEECDKLIQEFVDSCLEDFDEVFPEGIK